MNCVAQPPSGVAVVLRSATWVAALRYVHAAMLRIDRDHENFRVELSLPGYREVRLKLDDKRYVPRNQGVLLATGLDNFDRSWDPLKQVLLPYTDKPTYGKISRKKIRGHRALCFGERHEPQVAKLQYCIDPNRSVVLREQSADGKYEYLDYASVPGGHMFPHKATIRKDPLVNIELRDIAVSYQPLDRARFAIPEQSIELETCKGEQHPKPIFTPSPSYTDQARAKRDQATVLVHAFVAADGSVMDAEALNPTGDGLDVNARKTMLTWKFQPATCSGRPVSAEMMVEVSFKLY